MRRQLPWSWMFCFAISCWLTLAAKTNGQLQTPANWFVDKNAPSGGDGTQGAPYQKVQDAVNEPDVQSGHIIYVSGGPSVQSPDVYTPSGQNSGYGRAMHINTATSLLKVS